MPKEDKAKGSRTRQSRSQKQSSKAIPVRKKKLYIVLAILVAVLLFWIFIAGGKVLFGMQAYLNDKYDANFIVGQPRLTDSGFAVPGMWRATAYPINDRSLKFEVVLSQGSERYGDRYTGAVWSRDERPKVKRLLDSLYSTTPSFDVDVHTTSVGPDPVRGEVPNLEAATKSFGSEISYGITVHLERNSLTEVEKSAHLTKIEKIAQFIEDKGVGSPSVRYVINLSNEDAGYLCQLSGDKFNNRDTGQCFNRKLKGREW